MLYLWVNVKFFFLFVRSWRVWSFYELNEQYYWLTVMWRRAYASSSYVIHVRWRIFAWTKQRKWEKGENGRELCCFDARAYTLELLFFFFLHSFAFFLYSFFIERLCIRFYYFFFFLLFGFFLYLSLYMVFCFLFLFFFFSRGITRFYLLLWVSARMNLDFYPQLIDLFFFFFTS